jgi:hypothetical protein
MVFKQDIYYYSFTFIQNDIKEDLLFTKNFRILMMKSSTI